MRICIHTSAYFDWEPIPEGESPEPGDVTKPDMNGDMLRRVLIELEGGETTYTDINVPEDQLTELTGNQITILGLRASMPRVEGVEPTDEQIALAWFLSQKVMPGHSPPSAWTLIEVDGNPDMQTFLNAYFI